MGENDDNTILAPSNFSKVWAHPPFLRPNAQMIFKSPSKIHFLYSFRAQTPVISYFRPLPQKFTQHPLTFFQNHPLTLAFTYIFPESSTHSSIHIHFSRIIQLHPTRSCSIHLPIFQDSSLSLSLPARYPTGAPLSRMSQLD